MELDFGSKKQVTFKNKEFSVWRTILLIAIIIAYFGYYTYRFMSSQSSIFDLFFQLALIFIMAFFAGKDTLRKLIISFTPKQLCIHRSLYKNKQILVHQIKAIDRNFEEWTIYLKNGKKIQFSDHEISKEEKPVFREIMNQLPKLHEHVYL